MSIEAMKMALEFIESRNKSAALWLVPDTPFTKTVTALRSAIEQAEKPVAFVQIAPQREWAWMPAPIKTQWGHDMVVADLAIDKDHTVSIYCERDQIKSVEAMFAPQPQQVEKPVAWMYDFMSDNEVIRDWMTQDYADIKRENGFNVRPLYTGPRQEQPLKINPADCHIRVGEVSEPISVSGKEPYDQTALELCNECGWRAMLPGDGCLVCARQKAKPVAYLVEYLNGEKEVRFQPNGWGDKVTPLYTEPPAAPKPYRRGTYVRCIESDELCRVWTTSIDGGAWVRWPDGSITTYTAEQMGQAFSLEQAAPGKPVAYVDERIHGWPDCFVMEPDPPHTVPLYTEPREWVGLTEEDIKNELWPATLTEVVRLVETKLKDKNR